MTTQQTTSKKFPPNPFRRMSASEAYDYIIKCFLLRRDPDERVYQGAIAKDTGRGSYAGESAWTRGARMTITFVDGATVLRSYRMILAAWISGRLVLNGDGAPTQDTSRHQQALREQIERLNGIRYVHEPDPFELWTDELRARNEAIEMKHGKGDFLSFGGGFCHSCNEMGKELVARTKDDLSLLCCGECMGKYPDTIGPRKDEEKSLSHSWWQSDGHTAAMAEWGTDPEWIARRDKWSAEKELIHAEHQYFQKLAAHCAECGVEIPPIPDHANSAARDQAVHEPWCKQVGNKAAIFNAAYSFIPFSVLGYNTMDGSFMSWRHNDIAGLRFSDFDIVDATPDRKIIRTVTTRYKVPNRNAKAWGRKVYRMQEAFDDAMVCPKCKQRFTREDHIHSEDMETHFLGETLFRVRLPDPVMADPARRYRYYICGLDRNDNPGRRNFYMARLQDTVLISEAKRWPPQNVEDALHHLKPWQVIEAEKRGVTVRRQGEWFLIPTDRNFPVKDKDLTKNLAITTDKAGPNDSFRRVGRHMASRMLILEGAPKDGLSDNDQSGVYVKGEIRDAEHDTTYLGDTWHRVVRNTADGSWSVDKNGPKVD